MGNKVDWRCWEVMNCDTSKSILPKLIRVHPVGRLPEKKVITGISYKYALTV